MAKNKNHLWTIILFSIIWIARPISYNEMRMQHPIDLRETQSVIDKSSIFSFKKRSSNLEDVLFSEPDELKLFEESDQVINCFSKSNLASDLPRPITNKDKTVKFDKHYNQLFKKNYEKVFGYDLYFEENVSKYSSNKEINQAKQNLFQRYNEDSKEYLKQNLFQNPYVSKSEKNEGFEIGNSVTIYYNKNINLFASVDRGENCLLNFGIATEEEISFLPNEELNPKSRKLKEVVQQEEPIRYTHDEAMEILEAEYGSKFLPVKNGEFKIQDWQAAKKIEHAVCFDVQPSDYNFSQKLARKINSDGIVLYVRKDKPLPSSRLIKAYQNAVKNFCEDKNLSKPDYHSTFIGRPSITFSNKNTRQVAIFDGETKIFISAYKLSEPAFLEFKRSGNIQSNTGRNN